MKVITIQGTYSRPEAHKGQHRIRVIAGSVTEGETITAMVYDPTIYDNVPQQFRVTGLGAKWQEPGYIIDEEDARSFGGQGESIIVGSPGELQYAYCAAVTS